MCIEGQKLRGHARLTMLEHPSAGVYRRQYTTQGTILADNKLSRDNFCEE